MLIFAIIIFGLFEMTQQKLVSTAQGIIRGIVRDGYISYIGVPYASAYGTGRFKMAGLPPIWAGIREPNDQHCTISSQVEKCLHLDIYVPASNELIWPVLVWVKASSGFYHPGQLVKRGIIVVVVRHRMGVLGFLCTQEEQIPGNVGVKDVVLALRWVRDNIVAFKGNPNNVVLAGESFGAAMVETLMLSQMSHGLFHGAIMQSGTALSPWAFNYDAKSRVRALREVLNTSANFTSFLLEMNIEDLVTKSETMNMPYMPYGICIEKSFKNEESLLAEPPFQLLSDGKLIHIPVIIGYNNNEAYIFANVLKLANVLKRLPSDMAFLLPIEVNNFTAWELNHTRDKIKEIYFKNNNFSNAAILAYFSDVYFINHIHRTARLHSLASQYPVYYYQFSYSGVMGVESESGMDKTGAAHSDELSYLFSESGRSLNGDDGKVQDNLVTLWTNFAKYLNPTPHRADLVHWEALDHREPRLLNIGREIEMIDYPYASKTNMWDEIYDRFYTKMRSTANYANED